MVNTTQICAVWGNYNNLLANVTARLPVEVGYTALTLKVMGFLLKENKNFELVTYLPLASFGLQSMLCKTNRSDSSAKQVANLLSGLFEGLTLYLNVANSTLRDLRARVT